MRRQHQHLRRFCRLNDRFGGLRFREEFGLMSGERLEFLECLARLGRRAGQALDPAQAARLVADGPSIAGNSDIRNGRPPGHCLGNLLRRQIVARIG